MPNNIDLLMQKDPLELSARDIDEIIVYERKARTSYESGVRVKKADSGPKVDLIQLGLMKAKTTSLVKRKI